MIYLFYVTEFPCSYRDVHVANAYIKHGDIDNNVVEVECDQGYKLQGQSKLYCRNGKWEQADFPVCLSQHSGKREA